MLFEKGLTKDNLDECLKMLGKEFRKLNAKKAEAEIILVGGAAVLAQYAFRDSTYDIDAIARTSSVLKEAIYRVADNNKMPSKWLNTDFTKSSSYS